MAHGAVTIIDVALAAGVSKSAAARVLAQSGSASEKTRKKVLEAADRLGYRPNQLARAMKSGATNTIGIVVPDVAIPFFSAVVRGLADTARAAGFEVLVSNTDNDADIEARALELLAEQRVDGIVIAPVFQRDPAAIVRLHREGMPIVLLDRSMPGLELLPLVSVDHVDATECAVRALIDDGHRRIALVTEASAAPSELAQLTDRATDDADRSLLRPSAQRLIGYVRALRAAGLDVDDELIIRSGYTTADAQRAVHDFLGRGIDATALHATDAVLSSGAYRGIRACGLSVPDDLSFIGFDDQDWTTMVEPAVTVVEQPRQRLGATATTILVGIIRGGATEPLRQMLAPELLVRGSVAAPSARATVQSR
ncbi:LacI family DNA-binding transcriptional regulator [Agromyces aerolatus]|uniref:LacI family DNA-binding transcriptional regulator n=1 Tax=Agromyces sp. LY-1074 TaxID=3074080 RepID=UPI0028584833|nr:MULTISPECIES: LacI family DNA-binding transcriptional regulator [unclassified Agromyces]MDR5698767.1 LacI family DNA-binding transcriptional regulator [Agromyces sp. LY-1074]MDR5705061.1 LacI family DNA-binding transcriptional regulator [Agromyces sp. LY-1358]